DVDGGAGPLDGVAEERAAVIRGAVVGERAADDVEPVIVGILAHAVDVDGASDPALARRPLVGPAARTERIASGEGAVDQGDLRSDAVDRAAVRSVAVGERASRDLEPPL